MVSFDEFIGIPVVSCGTGGHTITFSVNSDDEIDTMTTLGYQCDNEFK